MAILLVGLIRRQEQPTTLLGHSILDGDVNHHPISDESNRDRAHCGRGALAKAVFCQVDQPIDVRVEDLLDRLNATEMMEQLGYIGVSIPRLAMDTYSNGGEALHGVWSNCVKVKNHPHTHHDDDDDHHHARLACPTQFASPITLGASFDRHLWQAIGDATSTEIRALFEYNQRLLYHNNDTSSPRAHGLEGDLGLTYYTPNVNIIRDPRWGRIEEVPSEDPVLNGEYATHFISTFQYGYDGAYYHKAVDTTATMETRLLKKAPSPYLKAAAIVKHYAAYSLEVDFDSGLDRHAFNALVTERDWTDTYMPAFVRAVQKGRAAGVMCSYNAINGEPACTNLHRLQTLLRGGTGFNGVLVTDCGALQDAHQHHKRYATEVEAVTAALRAGVDQNCGGYYAMALPWALGNGTITVSHIRPAVRRLLTLRMQLGLFEPHDARVPHARLDEVDSPHHRWLARQSAREGLVLLQNRPSRGSRARGDEALQPDSLLQPSAHLPLLPLLVSPNNDDDDDDDDNDSNSINENSSKYKTIALLGPNANATTNHLGGYHGSAPFLPVSILSAMRALWPRSTSDGDDNTENDNVRYAMGCTVDNDEDETATIAEAVDLANAADVAVVVLGLCGNNYPNEDTAGICSRPTETETVDRTSVQLPGNQEKLLRAIVEDTETPVVLIVLSAGAVDLTWAKEHVDSILWTGYAGQSGGLAIVEALLGKINPGGALPYTWVGQDYVEAVKYGDMSFRTNTSRRYPGRAYRFLDESIVRPIWPFGFGLSFTSFAIEVVDVPFSPDAAAITPEETTSWTVRVANTGSTTGSVVVICYVSFEGDEDGIPKRSLFDFSRVGPIGAKADRLLIFDLEPSGRAIANEQGEWTHPLGWYVVECEAGGVSSTGKHKIRVAAAQEESSNTW